MPMTSTMTRDGSGSIWPGARALSIHFNKATPATINCSPRCPRRWARARQGTSEKPLETLLSFSEVPCRARAQRRGHLGEQLIVAGVALLKCIDKTLAPGHIDPLPSRVIGPGITPGGEDFLVDSKL